MSKLFSIALVVYFFSLSTNADMLKSDDFSYVGALTSNGWTAYSGADGSITSDGSVASLGSGAEDIRLVFSDRGSNPVFASFTINVSALPSTGGEYSFGFADSSLMESRFGFISEDGGDKFGLTIYGSGTDLLGTASGYSIATDYRVVMYFDGVNDHRLWVDPDGSEFDTPALQTTAANSDIDGFFFRQGGAFDNEGSSWSADDLLVATTYGELIPEPTVTGLLGLAGFALLLRRRFFK